MPWYSIRSVYHFGVKSDGKNVFEERAVCFFAETNKEAHELAKVESENYAEINEFIAHDEQLGYRLDPADLPQGHEVWSELFESNESLDEFYANRYGKYTYSPE